MGADELYGKQKHWNYGSTFDGLNKNATGGNNLGPTADFIFPQDKRLVSVVYGSSDGTSSLRSNRSLSGTVAGSATAQLLTGTSATISGQQKYWIYGQTQMTLPMQKNSFGTEKYWGYGSTDGSLFAAFLTGVIYGSSDGTSNPRVSRNLSGTSAGSATVSLTRNIPITVSVVPTKKYVYGRSFDALSKNTTTIGGQKYWTYGSPQDFVFPLSPAAKKQTYIHNVRSGPPRKRQTSGRDPGIRVISPYYEAGKKQ